MAPHVCVLVRLLRLMLLLLLLRLPLLLLLLLQLLLLLLLLPLLLLLLLLCWHSCAGMFVQECLHNRTCAGMRRHACSLKAGLRALLTMLIVVVMHFVMVPTP